MKKPMISASLALVLALIGQMHISMADETSIETDQQESVLEEESTESFVDIDSFSFYDDRGLRCAPSRVLKKCRMGGMAHSRPHFVWKCLPRSMPCPIPQ